MRVVPLAFDRNVACAGNSLLHPRSPAWELNAALLLSAPVAWPGYPASVIAPAFMSPLDLK